MIVVWWIWRVEGEGIGERRKWEEIREKGWGAEKEERQVDVLEEDHRH